MIDTEPYFLSWQGKIQGPHDLAEIRDMLRRGEINSLYRIQIGRQWELLRDYLPRIDRSVPEAVQAAEPIVEKPAAPPPPPIAKIVPDEDDVAAYEVIKPTALPEASTGASLACFVLSLLFFIPGVNLIAWILGLIFGHIALDQQTSAEPTTVSEKRAWFGLRMCYIMGTGFLIQASLLSMMDLPALTHQSLILTLHASLLGNALAALVVAALLLAALRILTGEIAIFSQCYIASILSCSLGGLAMGLLSGLTGIDLTSGTRKAVGVALLAMGILILVLGAACFRIVRQRDGSHVSGINSAVASFFSVIITAVVLFVYMFIFGDF
jgi:hypothetical protein